MAQLRIRFSRCAPPNAHEMWRDFFKSWSLESFIDYSEWICRLTHCPFSHGDLVLDDGNLLGSSNNPSAPVVIGNPSGVAIRPPEYQRFMIRRDAIMETTDLQKQVFEDFCRSQLGKPFDTEALKPAVFLSSEFANRDWRKDDKWFCFEMLGRATEISLLLGWFYPGIKNRMTGGDYLNWVASKIDFDAFLKPIPGLMMKSWEA